MTSTPPFVAQERPDSCAVACLRMLLAQQGVEIGEDELIRHTTLDEGGLTPDELAALSRHFGLPAIERRLDDKELVQAVRRGRYPIVSIRKFAKGRRLVGEWAVVVAER